MNRFASSPFNALLMEVGATEAERSFIEGARAEATEIISQYHAVGAVYAAHRLHDAVDRLIESNERLATAQNLSAWALVACVGALALFVLLQLVIAL